MKEVQFFESWADSIIEKTTEPSNRMGTPMKSMADRPLPRNIDVQYKAQRKYPELSPEQAFAKFLDDELENNERVDNQQNKKISSIDKEINDVEQDEQAIKTELSKVEHDEAQLKAQLARLIDLVKRQ